MRQHQQEGVAKGSERTSTLSTGVARSGRAVLLRHPQQGMGFIGLVLSIAALIIVAVIGMKLWPAYYEFFVVKRVLNSVAQQPTTKSGTVADIRRAVSRQFEVDSVTVKSITAQDVEVTRSGGNTVLSVSYAVKEQLFSNVSVCIQFDATSGR